MKGGGSRKSVQVPGDALDSMLVVGMLGVAQRQTSWSATRAGSSRSSEHALRRAGSL